MANEFFTMSFEDNEGIFQGRLERIVDQAIARRLLREAIDDIADAVEAQVQRIVPVGETGQLKLHPLDREDTRIGIAEPGIFQFARGGGPGVTGARGAGGRFIRGGAGLTPGQLVASSTITVAKVPKHAIFVHDGTGIFRPGGKPITTNPPGRFMKFTWQGKRFRLKEVKGQMPQPYLLEAFLLIDRVYVPARVQLLRAQIAAEI